MTLRSKKAGLLSASGSTLNPSRAAQLRDIFSKGRKKRQGLLDPNSQPILCGMGIDSAANPTPLVLTPGSTGV